MLNDTTRLIDTSKIEVENKLKEISKNGDVEEIREYGDLIYYSLNRKDSLGKVDIANLLEETKEKSRIETKKKLLRYIQKYMKKIMHIFL